MNRIRLQYRHTAVRLLGASAAKLAFFSVGLVVMVSASASGATPVVDGATNTLAHVAHFVPTRSQPALDTSSSPSSPGPEGVTDTGSAQLSTSKWVAILVYVLFGAWMLLLAGIVAWLAMARKKNLP